MTTPEQSPPAEPGPDTDSLPDASLEPPEEEPDHPTAALAGRPRIVTASISRDRGWQAVVGVVLERHGRTAEARQEAIGEEVVVLRCAAETTLAALHHLLGGPARFALVGVKRVLAFDSAVILACVRTCDDRPRRLIGCVPVSEDPVLSVAHAVLHATNRTVEALPDGTDDIEPSADDAEPPPAT